MSLARDDPTLVKQLLVAESEVNRAQLVADIAALRAEIEMLAERATSMESLAALALRVCEAACAARGTGAAAARPRRGWLRSALAAGAWASRLWRAFAHERRPPGAA